jgi:hypothetical protein
MTNNLNCKKTHSIAHQRSEFAIIDPLYSPDLTMPSPDVRADVPPWLYGYGELECYRLQQLRRNVGHAKLKVGYPGNFHKPSEHVQFRHRVISTDIIVLHAVGAVRILLGGSEIRAENKNSPHKITLPADVPAQGYLLIELFAEDEPPAILIESSPYSTADNNWEWSDDGINWEAPKAYPQTGSGTAPHKAQAAEAILSPVGKVDGLFDFGRELFGKITIRGTGKPEISVGESRAEANNAIPEYCEQSMTVHSSGSSEWCTLQPVAFRYVRTEGADITCRAHMHPVRYRGAFACSDKQLTRIWINSAYTLRLCMQDFILDGVKRDRLPWVGDLVMSMMADAYAFGDAEIVRSSLTALGREGIAKTHLNGIIDYSLWWIIAHDYFQRYFGDKAYLHREWPRIKEMISSLEASCDADGMLIKTSKDWLFIDWVKSDKITALQMLWWWALDSAIKLAERLGENEYAEKCRDRADKLAAILHDTAWDRQHKLWMGIPGDRSSAPSRHAHFLSVISGLAKSEQTKPIRTNLLGDAVQPVGTPYMAGFENIALSKLNAVDEMISRVNAYWGGMLERGATTFWEAYDPEQHGDDSYSFYGRPFGKSLCHAWSAGPTAFIPLGILGLEPIKDGWGRFKVEPRLGTLDWAAATVPTPQGEIEVLVEEGAMSLRIPDGTVAEWQGRELTGQVKIPLSKSSL